MLAVSSFVLVVLVVLVSSIGEVVFSDSECESVASQTFFFFSLSLWKGAMRSFSKIEKDMNAEGTRQGTPPAPTKGIRGMEYGGERRWSTLDKTVTARTEHFQYRSESLEGDIEKLEYYPRGPEESDVDIRHLALKSKRRTASKAFPHFQSAGAG